MKQRQNTAWSLLVLILLTLMPSSMWAQTATLYGEGTQNSPYQIYTADHLELLRQIVEQNDKNTQVYAKLCNNITLPDLKDAAETKYIPIGTESKPFCGEFNGWDNAICVDNISSKANNFGVFGYINNATIKDLKIKAVKSSVTMNFNHSGAGTVVGRANGDSHILNVQSKVNVSATSGLAHIGGIVGWIQDQTEVSGCTYSGQFTADNTRDCIGGIVGYCYNNSAVSITNCLFSGQLSTQATSTPYLGGIVGYLRSDKGSGTLGTIANNFSGGTLSAPSATEQKGVAAIVGYPKDNAADRYSFSNNHYLSGTANQALGNDKSVSGNAPISISVTADEQGQANWIYLCPTTTTTTQLQATATTTDNHYEFEKWSGITTSTDNPLTIGLDADVELKANFSMLDHDYTKTIGTDDYLATPATCTQRATYYYCCSICNKSEEDPDHTFASGVLGHCCVDGQCTICGKALTPYRVPSYNIEGEAKSGIARWQTGYVADVTTVTGASSEVTWSAGWYLVSSEVTCSKKITCSGDVHLILAPGGKLNANKSIIVSGNDNSLTIYGQPEGAGEIAATGEPSCAGIGGYVGANGNNITINGGTVNATGGIYAAGIGGGDRGSCTNITINGGIVTATGYLSGIGSGENGYVRQVTINGGIVSAKGAEWGIGGQSRSNIYVATRLKIYNNDNNEAFPFNKDGDIADKISEIYKILILLDGDLNVDDKVTVGDLSLLIDYLGGGDTNTNAAFDVNRDNSIDQGDVEKLRNLILKP